MDQSKDLLNYSCKQGIIYLILHLKFFQTVIHHNMQGLVLSDLGRFQIIVKIRISGFNKHLLEKSKSLRLKHKVQMTIG